MAAQDLQSYSHRFEETQWITVESEHYQFNVFPNSLAARELDRIIRTQESAYQKVTEFLGIEGQSANKIKYYLYTSLEQKRELMGSDWYAQAIYTERTIHALYSAEHKVIGPHEDTHLLSLHLGLAVGFMQEGLAEYLVGHDWFGNPFEEVFAEVRDNDQFVIKDTLPAVHAAWLETEDTFARHYYALAALFTRHIIDSFGKERLFALYRRLDRDASHEENERAYLEELGTSSRGVFEQLTARNQLRLTAG
jgi:hypothetical protein